MMEFQRFGGYTEEDYLMISGIQHFAFCRRQWALIHIEQAWEENVRTLEGSFLHEKAHCGESEKRGDLLISRNLPVFSNTLGISGNCDIVEFHRDPKGVTISGRDGLFLPIPVEYKVGKPKEHNADMMQLCAQALCLEEMLLCKIEKGHLYYGDIRRRIDVTFDDELRVEVKSAFEEMHRLFERRYTPKVKPTIRCKLCSLENLCMPKLCQNLSVDRYIKNTVLNHEEEFRIDDKTELKHEDDFLLENATNAEVAPD